MRPELILWDWNGTLLDDVALCVDALNRLLARYGYPQRYNHEQYRAIFGFPVQDYYARAGFDFTRDSFDDLARSFMEDYIPASEACPLLDGAREALDAFARAGLRQVILSASPITTLEHQVAVRGVAPYFDRLLGLGDIYAKSKVDLGLQYLAQAGFDPRLAVMIGDSTHDFEVAQALGVGCVLQSSGHQPGIFCSDCAPLLQVVEHCMGRNTIQLIADRVDQVHDSRASIHLNTGNTDITAATTLAFYQISLLRCKARSKHIVDLAGHTAQFASQYIALYLGVPAAFCQHPQNIFGNYITHSHVLTILTLTFFDLLV